MQMLGEMGTVIPASGSFSEYAEHGIGRWAGFTQGWIYWLATVAVLGAEITGAAGFIGSWFNVSPWIPAAVCVVLFGIINLLRVRSFGEFEYWFALIKVIVIVAFLIIGALLILGLLPGHSFIGTSVFLEDGFMPNGLGGVAAGLLAVAFAFGGIEVVAIASAESEDPEKSLVNAVRSTILRISVFYLAPSSSSRSSCPIPSWETPPRPRNRPSPWFSNAPASRARPASWKSSSSSRYSPPSTLRSTPPPA